MLMLSHSAQDWQKKILSLNV